MTSESTTITDLIKEVAQKHHVALSYDDPILIFHTVNERLLQENAKAQKLLLDQYKSETEMLIKRCQEDGQKMAEKIINTALTASKKIMEEKAEALSESMQKEIHETITPINVDQLQQAKRFTVLNLFVCALITLSAFIVLWGLYL